MEILLDTLKWSAIVGALTLVLTLLKPAFEKRYSARWRYWAWLALAVLALLGPVQWEKLLPSVPAAPVMIDVPEMELQVIRGDRVSVTMRPVASAPSEGQRTWQLAEVLPVIWLAGAAAFGLYTLAGTRLFRHKARRWGRKPNEQTLRIYETVWQDMGLNKVPPLLVSSAAGSPMLAGVICPCLLLPGEDWSEREMGFILRHELTHYRRHDLWYKLILLAANALHWFNPLIYLLVKEANADMELTCDDEVVSGEGQETRRAYSETLLSAVRRNKRLGTALSTNFYGGKTVMKERFRNILGKRGQKWGVLALALTLLVTVVSACAFGLRQADAAADAAEVLVLRNEAKPDAGETAGDEVQAYIHGWIAYLTKERGVTVTDQRSKMTMVDTFEWDFYDSEMQVWALDYALKLERPEDFTPVGSEAVDADGWLSGLEGGQGDPYFIYSVYRGEEEPETKLEEIAYSSVVWEDGYTWEEYVCCHTLFGLDLSSVLNGWPEVSTEFIQAMLDGHETWAMDWEDVALSYLSAQGEDPDLDALSSLCVWTFEENFSHDESRLLSFRTASGRTGMMLLTHIVYPVEAWKTTLYFWQVAGILWHDEAEAARSAEAFMRQFLDYEAAGDADNVIALEYFDNNWESELKYETIKSLSQAPIENYEILSGEKVNDRLYAFCIKAVIPHHDEPQTFYNFVMVLDDGYRAACNVANIPAEVSAGADLSRFDLNKDDPDYLGRPDEDENGNLTGYAPED